MKRIWSKYIDFEGHIDKEYCVDSSLYLSIFASIYNTNIIWYDINQVMTYVSILTKARGKDVDKIVSRKGYVAPVELCKYSSWKKCVVLLYGTRYYQNIKEHDITNS